VLIEDALVEFLRRTPAVVALVGDRIYPEQAAVFAAYPRVTYELSGTDPERTLGGDSDQPAERWLIHCWGHADAAEGYRKARALARAVLTADGDDAGGMQLRNYLGWLPPKQTGSSPAVWVQCCRGTEVRGGEPEQPPGGEPKPTHKITVELTICYLYQE
jgi:Protein of unknown function (DUF3168)